jgi:hypothetical protein
VAAGGANPLALLVAPLAGIALMTAAAAVAISPVLLTVSLTGKRRRRRDAETTEMDQGISPQLEEKMHEIQVRKSTPNKFIWGGRQDSNKKLAGLIYTSFPLLFFLNNDFLKLIWVG